MLTLPRRRMCSMQNYEFINSAANLYLHEFLLIQQNCLYQQFFILPEPISRRHFSNFTNFAFLYKSVICAQ